MAFDLVPPPPPTAPLSYSPPNDDLKVTLDLNIFEPIREAVGTAIRHLELSKVSNSPSTAYYIASNLHNILFNEQVAPLWKLFPSQPTSPDIVFAELRAIRAVLSSTPPAQTPHPTALPDTVALTTLGRKIDELKAETKTSLKSFAEAVKAPAHQPPPQLCNQTHAQEPPAPP